MDDEFRRDADRIIKRLRDEGKLLPLRRLLKGLLVTVEPMNLGDVADHVIEDAAQREALQHLERLGCLTVLGRSESSTIKLELFSKLRLACLAERVDAALRSHGRD